MNNSHVTLDEFAAFSADLRRAVELVAATATLLGHKPGDRRLLEILANENGNQLSPGGAELSALLALVESLQARRVTCLLLCGMAHEARVRTGDCEPLEPEYVSQHERIVSLIDRFISVRAATSRKHQLTAS
jgi:hypothetical protein